MFHNASLLNRLLPPRPPAAENALLNHHLARPQLAALPRRHAANVHRRRPQ